MRNLTLIEVHYIFKKKKKKLKQKIKNKKERKKEKEIKIYTIVLINVQSNEVLHVSTPYTSHPNSTTIGFGAKQHMTLTLIIEKTKENIKYLIIDNRKNKSKPFL